MESFEKLIHAITRLVVESSPVLWVLALGSVAVLSADSYFAFMEPVKWFKAVLWIALIFSCVGLLVRLFEFVRKRLVEIMRRRPTLDSLETIGLSGREFIAEKVQSNTRIFPGYDTNSTIVALEQAGLIVRGRPRDGTGPIAFQFPDFVWDELTGQKREELAEVAEGKAKRDAAAIAKSRRSGRQSWLGN